MGDQDKEFLFLPCEIRVKIYKCLSYADSLNLRLVCQKVKSEVDSHIEIHVKVDQSYRTFRQLLRRRVRSIFIAHLTHRNISKENLFLFPLRVRKIVLDGNITKSNFLKLLSQCHRVQELVLTHECLGIENLLASTKAPEILRQLTSVTRLNLQFLRYPMGNPFELETNIESFLSATFPCLSTFQLYFSIWGNWLSLLNFLKNHVGSLRELELQVGDRGDSQNTEAYFRHFPHQRLTRLVDCNPLLKLNLTELRFRDDVLHLNPTIRNLFLDILKKQNQLRVLEFHTPGDISVNFLKEIVKKNEGTLTEVAIYNLKNPEPAEVSPNLHMSFFSNCSNLKIVALSCAPSPNNNNNDVHLINNNNPIPDVNLNLNNNQNVNLNVNPNELPDANNDVEVSNVFRISQLSTLPDGMERIHLTGFSFQESDIVDLSHRSPNLKELLLVDGGQMRYSTILSNLLRNCPKIQYLNVRPVIARASNDHSWWTEVNHLSHLYNKFMGVPFDPIDDLDGFEAFVNELDREWIRKNVFINPS